MPHPWTIHGWVWAAALAVLLCSCAAPRQVAPSWPARGDVAFSLSAGPRINIRHHELDVEEAEIIGQLLREVYPQVREWGDLDWPVVIWLHPNHGALEQATGRVGYGWLRAWARHGELHLETPRTWGFPHWRDAMRELLTHELTHIVMYQAIGGPDDWAAREAPLWFREGMASVTARQGYRRGKISELKRYLNAAGDSDPFHAPDDFYRDQQEWVYNAGHHAFAFLHDRYGARNIRRIFQLMRGGDSFDDAFASAIGVRPRVFLEEFRRYVLWQSWERQPVNGG